jgi:tryptophan 7-halogenase
MIAADKPIRAVVVVGGGSAGWLAAARIAARNSGSGHDPVVVTLVESSTVPPIGVGEGTWPTMRNTLAKIGVSETEFIQSCDAAFKQGARFVSWVDGSADDGYYHPLNPPIGATELNLSPHWEALSATASSTTANSTHEPASFADCVDFQAALCTAGLAPKDITSAEFRGAANYAYHLDAGKFATLLREHAVKRLGVRHVVGDVVRVHQAANGDIETLELADGQSLAGDLFVDCSGFAAILIDGVYKVPFRRCGDRLFADRAMAMQVPYPDPDAPITCHTVSTAQGAGWIWDIGLWTRRGIGYVYSSSHASDDEAEATLRRYVGPAANQLSARKIVIQSGHREWFWQNNCVAVGLSAGFLEPLEASALLLIEVSMDNIADRLPRTRSAMDVIARQFNQTFQHHWNRIIEFLKLHYVLTKRTDTAFWRDNVVPASIPESLQERLQLWRVHPPGPPDFPHAREVFSWPSYQYILHGMHFRTRYAELAHVARETADAKRLLTRAAQLRKEALQQMPRHRELLKKIRTYGLQAV